MQRLKDQIAVITGGNSGIGLAAAERFIAEGAQVVLFGRNGKTLGEAVARLGATATGVNGDVTNQADLDRLFANNNFEGPLYALFCVPIEYMRNYPVQCGGGAVFLG